MHKTGIHTIAIMFTALIPQNDQEITTGKPGV